jgi:hypothetical protein
MQNLIIKEEIEHKKVKQKERLYSCIKGEMTQIFVEFVTFSIYSKDYFTLI